MGQDPFPREVGQDTVVKNIAVTGGDGFLGKATVQSAKDAGHNAWAFDQTLGDDVLGDLSKLEGADTVVHLAGVLGTSELFDNAETAIDVNIRGTVRVLDWCLKHGASYVGISMLPVFPSVYTATKVCSQNLASAWHKAYGLPVSHVRAFNAFGPHQAYGPGHPQKIAPTFATAAWEGRPLPIWGDGDQTIDLIHVRDVGRMLLDATNFGEDQLFEAGTGQAVSVFEFAQFVLNHTGSDGGIEYLPMRIGEEPTQIVAQGLGWETLGWRPSLNWNDVADTIDWYKDA